MVESLGTSRLRLATDPTDLRAGMALAREEALNQTRSLQQTLNQTGASLAQTGRALTANVTLPIIGMGAAVFKVGADFQKTLNQIVGLTDVTRDEIGGIKDSLIALGKETGRTPQELAEAFYFVASAGFTAKEAMDVMTIAARASAAGLGRTQDVAQVLGLTLNAYGHENITAAHAADVLVAAVKDGTAEADAFASVLGRVIPTAATLGVSFDQVTAALAGMTLTGLSADEAATSLNQVLVSLLKPTAEAEKALQGMGITSGQLREELKDKGLLATLRDLEKAFNGNDQAAAQVFGNVRALRGVLALLTLDSDKLNGVFADTAKAQGDLADGYKETEGASRDFDRLVARVQATLIDLGETAIPLILDGLDFLVTALETIARLFGMLPDPIKTVLVVLLELTAIVGPLLLLAAAVITVTGALVELGVALLPVAIIIGGVVLAVGLLYTAITAVLNLLNIGPAPGKKWESFVELIGDGVDALTGKMNAAGVAVGDLSDKTDSSLSATQSRLDQFPGKVEDDLGVVAKAFQKTAAEGPEAYKERTRKALHDALATQLDYSSKALAALQQFRSDIEDAFKTARDTALDAERTQVAIGEKLAELNALDDEYTKKHSHWTKLQGRQWRLRRDEAVAALADLQLHLALIGDDIQKTAALKSVLASKEMKSGLTSKFPETREAFRTLRDQALEKLGEIAEKGGPAAKDAAATIAKYLDPANKNSPFNDAGTWGTNTANAFTQAIARALRVTHDMKVGMGRIAGWLEADSPPRDPSNPLHFIDRWGENTGRGWLDPFIRVLAGARDHARAPMADLAGVLAMPLTPPSLALAAASSGIGGGVPRVGPPPTPSGKVEKHYNLTVQGNLVARDKDEVLATLQRMDAIGRDD